MLDEKKVDLEFFLPCDSELKLVAKFQIAFAKSVYAFYNYYFQFYCKLTCGISYHNTIMHIVEFWISQKQLVR